MRRKENYWVHDVQNCPAKFCNGLDIDCLTIKTSKKYYKQCLLSTFPFSGELFFSLNWTSEIGGRDNTQLSKKLKKNNQCRALSKHLQNISLSLYFQFRCWQRSVSGEDTSGWLQHPHTPWRVSGDKHCTSLNFIHNGNFYVKRALFSKTPSGGNPSSTSQAVTMMWPVQGEKENFMEKYILKKKYLGQCPEPPLCPQSSDTLRLNLKFIYAGNGNMDISGSYCHTFCPNSGQFKDS